MEALSYGLTGNEDGKDPDSVTPPFQTASSAAPSLAAQPIPTNDSVLSQEIVNELSKTSTGRHVLNEIRKKGIKVYVFDLAGGPGGYYNGPHHSDPPGYNNSIMINLHGRSDVRQVVDSIVHEYRHSTQTRLQNRLYGPNGAYARRDLPQVQQLKEQMEADAYRYELQYQIDAGRIPNARSGWVQPDGRGGLMPNQTAIDAHVRGNAVPDNSTTNVAAKAGQALKANVSTINYRQLGL